MPSVAPIVVAQTGQFHLTDYYYARSSVLGLPYIPGASLPNGTRWLILAEGTLAGEYLPLNVPPMTPYKLEAHVIQGYPSQKTYAYRRMRSNLHGSPESYRAGSINAAFILDSNGTDLEFMFWTVDGGFDAWLSGFQIVAYPLADMVEGVDYFFENTVGDGTDVGAPMLTTTSTTYAPILSKTYNIQVPGQYLILGNCGMNTIQNQAAKIRLVESGSQIGAEWTKKMYASTPSDDRVGASFMEVRTLAPAPGNIVYELQGASVSGGNDKKFYQPRIMLFRLGYFKTFQAVTQIATTVTQNYPNWQVVAQANITPTVDDDYVLWLGNTTHYPGVQGYVANRIRDISQANFIDDGQAEANYFDANVDRMKISTFGCQPVSGLTNYALEATGEIGNTTLTNGTLVAIQLTPGTAVLPPLTIDVTETVDIGESYSGLIASITRSETVSIVESSSLVSSGVPGSIPDIHPRIYLTSDRLSYLRSQAGYNDVGVQVTPPGSTFFQECVADAATVMGGNYSNGREYSMWQVALLWKITQDATYINWIKSHLADICKSTVWTYESGGLSTGRWMRQAALIYDWCYNDLTAAERTHFQNYMMGVLYCMLRNQDHPTFGQQAPFTPSQEIFNPDWSRNDPTNNYFVAMMQATVYCGLVLYHDVWPDDPAPVFNWPPGTTDYAVQFVMPLKKPGHTHPPATPQPPLFTDGWEYCKARMEQLVVQWWNRKSSGGIVGGGWHEGYWYKPMWAAYECLRLMDDVAGYTPPMNNYNPKDFINHSLHQPMPGGTRPPELGDSGAADTRKSVGASDRALMLFLADRYRNDIEGQYAKWWLQNVLTAMPDPTDHQWDGYDFLFHDTRITATDYRSSAQKSYYSPSNGTVISRTGWTSADTACVLHSQDRIQLHEHAEQNGFQITCGLGGSSDAQFLIGPRCAYGASGENQNESDKTKNHCCYELGGVWQRPSNTNQTPWPNDNLPTGNIDRYSPHNGVFTYAQGNASDAYRLGAGTSITPDPRRKVCDVSLRDFIHITVPNVLLIYDRNRLLATTPLGETVPQTIKSYLHMTSATTPTNSGGIVTIQSSTARCFKKDIFPSGQSVTLTNENGEGGITYNCYEEVADLTVTSGYARRLMLFDITTTAQASIMPNVAITSANFHEGVSIDDGGTRYHILFALSQTGAAPAGDFYYDVVKLNNNDRHIVANLDPNFSAYIITEASQGAGVYRYTFQKGGSGVATDQGGVLSFTPATLTEGPTVNIAETAIALTDSIASTFDFMVLDESAIAMSEPAQTINEFFVISESAITLADTVEFGVQAEVEINEIAITIGPETIINFDTFDLAETPLIVFETGSFYFDNIDSAETGITLTDTTINYEVVAPLTGSVAMTDTVTVSVIAPPDVPPPPGTAGTKIDTGVSFEGDIDTEVSF